MVTPQPVGNNNFSTHNRATEAAFSTPFKAHQYHPPRGGGTIIPTFQVGAMRRHIIDQGFHRNNQKISNRDISWGRQQELGSSELLTSSDLLRIQNKRDMPNNLNHSFGTPVQKRMKTIEYTNSNSSSNREKDDNHQKILSGKFVSDTLMRAVEKACLELRQTIPRQDLADATESALITFYNQIHSIHSGNTKGPHVSNDDGIIRSSDEDSQTRVQIIELRRKHDDEKITLGLQHKAEIDKLKQEHEMALLEIMDQHKEEIRQQKERYHQKFENYLNSTRESLKIVRGSIA